MSGSWRLTSTNYRYEMAEPPVPSSSNNWPNGWIHSARSLQNWELTLDTWAPESISVVISCLSTITGASLECPTKQAMGSGFRKGQGWPLVFFWATLSMVSFGLGSGREHWGPTVGCCGRCQWEVGPQSLSSPQTGLNLCWGTTFPSHVVPTLASEALEGNGVFPIWSASLAIFGCLGILSLASSGGGGPHSTQVLSVEAVCPRTVQPLWELGWPGMFLSVHPLPQSLCLGLFGALLGLLPYPALVRAVISLTIWFPNSVVPLTGLVVTADLAISLSWASLFLLSALQTVIMSWE